MAGPWQSILIPYENQIFKMRTTKPPATYKAIAEYMKDQFQIIITPASIHNFVKVRSLKTQQYIMPPSPNNLEGNENQKSIVKEKTIGLVSHTLKRPVDDESAAPPPPSIPGNVPVLPDDYEANTATKPLQLKTITPRKA